MKKVFIIHAHPEEQSFCSSLKNTAIDFFKNRGDEVRVSDLYTIQFNPVGGKHDFRGLKNGDFFKYQIEQVNAYENDLFEESLKKEMENFEWCDILIFNFPLWWFGLPAILKGWVDRVFAMGFVYGNGKGVYDSGAYQNKTAFAVLTTGGPEIAYNGGKNGNIMDILYPINHGMFYFAGMKVIQPFICYSPARREKQDLEKELNKYKIYLENIDNQASIY